MMPETYRWFVGIDWATESHEVCVLDRERNVIDGKTIEHCGSGIAQLVERLLKLSGHEPAQIAVAIEMPRGALVETLVERRFAVYSLNPKQMDRFRDRHTVAGAKDDSRDAFVMADALSTDLHLFHRVRLDDRLVIRLRELSRTEEDVEQAMVRAGHQLRDLLVRYYRQMLKLCPGVDEPWFWDLIELAPLPGKAAKLTRSKVESLLRSHRIRRITAEQILAGLGVLALQLAPGAAQAASEHALLQLPLMRLLRKQKQDLAGRIQGVLEEMGPEGQAGEHRDVTIILSMPGVGRSVAATMLAEASQALAERDYHALRSYAGAAPITRQSGKPRTVSMRRSCNPRLRDALYHWARVSTHRDERSKKHYAELRSKGHSHGRALRGVADRLVAVLIAMLKSKTLYDPHFALPAAP